MKILSIIRKPARFHSALRNLIIYAFPFRISSHFSYMCVPYCVKLREVGFEDDKVVDKIAVQFLLHNMLVKKHLFTVFFWVEVNYMNLNTHAPMPPMGTLDLLLPRG